MNGSAITQLRSCGRGLKMGYSRGKVLGQLLIDQFYISFL